MVSNLIPNTAQYAVSFPKQATLQSFIPVLLLALLLFSLSLFIPRSLVPLFPFSFESSTVWLSLFTFILFTFVILCTAWKLVLLSVDSASDLRYTARE